MTGRREDDEPIDRSVTPIGEALGRVLAARGLGSAATLARIMAAWDSVVGADLARHVRPVSLQGRELVCEVDDPAWATQVKLLGEDLLRRLAESLGERLADQLSVRVRARRSG